MTLTKYLQNLLRESTLSVVSAAKIFLFKVVLMMPKMPSDTFLWMTRYMCMQFEVGHSRCAYGLGACVFFRESGFEKGFDKESTSL